MRKSFKYCLTFILTAIICIVLLIVTALIPKELVKSNMVKSSEEMYDISYIYLSFIFLTERNLARAPFRSVAGMDTNHLMLLVIFNVIIPATLSWI